MYRRICDTSDGKYTLFIRELVSDEKHCPSIVVVGKNTGRVTDEPVYIHKIPSDTDTAEIWKVWEESVKNEYVGKVYVPIDGANPGYLLIAPEWFQEDVAERRQGSKSIEEKCPL